MTKLPHLRWRDRCSFKRKDFFINLLWVFVIALAACGLWYSVTTAKADAKHAQAMQVRAEMVIKQAAARVAKAERDRQELLDVLAGDLVMVEPIGEYARIADVQWTLVKLEVAE